MSTSPIVIEPATTVIHLEFNAGEAVDLELGVFDKAGVPVPITAAIATIAIPEGPILHTWSAAAGNLSLLPDLVEPSHFTRVQLRTTAAETLAWYEAWADSEWQLETTDLFGRPKRPCEGQVRVRPTRRGTA